jgi:cytochrome c2
MRSIICCVGAALFLAAACAGATLKGDVARGKDVFEACAPCHNVDNDARRQGPSLRHLFKRPKLENGQAVSVQSVRAQIGNGGRQMPHYVEGPRPLLSPQELEDLIAYLRTL